MEENKPVVHAPCSKVQQNFLLDNSQYVIFGGGELCASTLKTSL